MASFQDRRSIPETFTFNRCSLHPLWNFAHPPAAANPPSELLGEAVVAFRKNVLALPEICRL